MNTNIFRCFPAIAGLCLSACVSVGPNYEEPGMPVPDDWSGDARKDERQVATGQESRPGEGDGKAAPAPKKAGKRTPEVSELPSNTKLEKWWTHFRDPLLNRLIDLAREGNPDLKGALSRVREARARRGVAASQLFPQVDATGDYVRTRVSENLLAPVPKNPSNLFALGFDSGWEIDVFGGVRRSIQAEQASLEGSLEDYRSVLISLYSEVALNYIEYRTFDERLRLARASIDNQQKTVQNMRDLLEAGLVEKYAVTRSESFLASTKALVPSFEAQKVEAKNRLASLLGQYPGTLDSMLKRRKPIPNPSKNFALGLPVDLLRARPDVRNSEREVAARSAEIGVATADLYPRFSLLGNFQLQAADASDLFKGSSGAIGFGPALRWNIFSAGQIRNLIKVAEERTQQAIHRYERTVLNAVEEVETTMVAIVNERRRLANLGVARAQAAETVPNVTDAFKIAGKATPLDILDAQRALLSAQDDEAFSKGRLGASYVTLFKSLGGGVVVSRPPRIIMERAIEETPARKPGLFGRMFGKRK